MANGHQPNRSRDVVFFIAGVIGTYLLYHLWKAIVAVYEWVASTDVISNVVNWWTTDYTFTIVPIDFATTLLGLFFFALIIFIGFYYMAFGPRMSF